MQSLFHLRRVAVLSGLFAAGAASLPAQQPDVVKFVRYPAIANDGTIAFTYHDDIWVARPDGSDPRRLTAHIARDHTPRFSPDGRWIAFTSNRMGNDDVFVMPVTGGEPQQLTWWTGNDQAVGWTPDGKEVLISSARGQSAWGSPLYRVALDGTIPRPLPMDMARTGALKQDATMVAFNRMLPSYWRKGYKGNANADIAVQDLRTGVIRELTDTVMQNHRAAMHDVHPMWGADGKVYYASERDGHFNLWRIDPATAAAEQVTRHRSGVQFPSASPDGKRIIYEHEFGLWTLDVPGGSPRAVPIRMAVDPKETDLMMFMAANRADDFTPSPTGDYVAVSVRGEIMIVPSESGVGEMQQVTNSPWRDKAPVWSPDGKHIAYVSDESGEEEVWLFTRETGAKRKLTTHESEKGNLLWSSTSAKLLFTGANRLFEIDVASGRATELAFNRAGGYTPTAYSADNRWVVYTRRDDDQNADVYLFEISSKREINVTNDPFTDGNGMLTPDGTHLVFTSNRTGTTHVYAVSLARMAEDPNDPLVRERRARAAAATTGGGRGGQAGQGTGAATAEAPAALTIRVDTDGIAKRAVALSSGNAGGSQPFLSRDGRTVYYTVGGGGGGGGGRGGAGATPAGESEGGLYAIGIDGQNGRRITAGSFAGITPTTDGRYAFFRRAAPGGGADAIGTSEVHRVAFATPTRTERVSFSFPIRVDRRDEWKQVFTESWRVMKYRFYDPDMHGTNWNAMKAKYEPLLPFVRTNEDLHDLTNEMIGELNASHTGVSGPSTRSLPRPYTTRYLGFELEPANGRYRISHIYRDGPADQEWLNLRVGDYVLAIDGQDVKDGDNYWRLLSTTLNTYIPVRVAKSAAGADARTVRINSVTNLGDIKYEEFVANNRDAVTKATNGEIAYVHIRSMNQPSLERFQREIDQFANAKGIIVDIRFNGGGNIDQQLIDILERRPYEYWNNRGGSPVWGRRPRQLIDGPKVMMINHRSGSDSEVTPQAFKDLGLGRVVGNPTAAAVIATGSYSLLHGGSIRTPGSLVVTFDPTKPNNFGINLENYGVEPDVWVRNGPMDILRGVDRELEEAIREVRRMQVAEEATRRRSSN
jgi:tricorn protease